MDQENVNKLVDWIKANRNYSAEQLRERASQNGFTEKDFNTAMSIVNAPAKTPNHKRMRTTFFVFVVLAIVIGGVLVWQYWLKDQLNEIRPQGQPATTQAPADKMADWATYKNDEYGFTIKYPITQGVKPFVLDGFQLIVEFKPQYAWDHEIEPIRMDISHNKHEGGVSLKEYIFKMWNEVFNFSTHNNGQPLTEDLLEPIVIGGLNGYKLIMPIEGISQQYNYILHEEEIFTFFVFGSGDFKEMANRMLSTFKFLEKTEAKDVVLDFYNCYMDELENNTFEERLDVCDYLEEDFKQELLDVEIRLADPVLLASDWPEVAYPKIVEENIIDDEAVVLASFPPEWEWHKAYVSLRFIGEEWKISNIEMVPDCTDSDGGKNYYIEGTVKELIADGRSMVYDDYCRDEHQLVEWFCADDGFMDNMDYECQYTCEDNVCVKKKSISLITPNGGEEWEIGRPYEIIWSSSGIDNVNISYLGSREVPAFVGKQKWYIGAALDIRAGNDYKIKVVDSSDPSIYDESDNYFSIVDSPESDHLIDNEGDECSYDIDKSETIPPVQVVEEFYNCYLKNGFDKNSRSLSEELKRELSTNYSSKLRTYNPMLFAQDLPPKNIFQVSQLLITDKTASVVAMFDPTWYRTRFLVSLLLINSEWKINNIERVPSCTDSDFGNNYFVEGTAKELTVYGKLIVYNDYCRDDGWLVEWSCLDDKFMKNTDYQCSYGCKDNACVKEQSISVTTPNGGEEWKMGNSHDVTWESSGIDKVDIILLPLGAHLNGAYPVSASLGKFSSGSLGAALDIRAGNNYRIKVVDSNDPFIYDESDDYFSIIKQPVVNESIDETAGWKVYRNEKYGLEFSHDPEWSISKINTGSGHDRSRTHVLLWAGAVSDAPCQEWVCPPKSGDRDEFTKGATYEGDFPFYPWFKILRVRGNKWVSIRVTDVKNSFYSEDASQQYLSAAPLSQKLKVNSPNYQTYNAFIELLSTLIF